MKYVHVFFLVSGAIISSACAVMVSPTSTATGMPAVPPKSGTIRVGFPTTADMGDVPSLMAHELLSAQGYTIQSTAFASVDIEAAALAQGEIDIANGSMRTLWPAIGKGADARTIMEQVANVWLLIDKPEFQTCADLMGKRIAFTSNSSLNRALFDAYTQQHCPALKFEQLTISGSDTRAAALLAGELDATPLELADWIQLEQKAPKQFQVLVTFAQELPNLKTTGVHVRRAFAEKNALAVRDYVRAVLTVHRTIKTHPTELTNATVKFLKLDAPTAQTIAQAYLARNVWDVNGGLTREDVQYSVDFFTRTKSIPEGLTADAVADLSYLNAVLAEIGRK